MERIKAGNQRLSIPIRGSVFGLTILMALTAFLATATAEGGTVRYSYEEVRIGGDREYVLVPRAEGSLRGEVTAQKLEQAFEALRRAKRPTYGNSYASVSGDAPYGARVEVHIDSNHSDFATVIIAEAVYTLTEFGVPEVHFPGFTDGGVTRADIAFAAYTLTVPLWKVVPETKVTTAQVIMPDGQLLPVAEVGEMWRRDRDGVVDGIYSYLKSSDPWTVRSVVRRLSEFGDLRVADVLPLLEHESRDVRRQALGVLEGRENETEVLAAVSKAMEAERNRTLARMMAEFLGASDDKQFNVEEQFFLIARGSEEEAEKATERLAEWDGDERVVELLSELLREEERENLPALAAASLDALNAHDTRVQALEDDKVEASIRRKISEDLADESNPDEVRLIALSYIAKDRTGGHAGQAIAAMAALAQDEARQQVESFLSDDSMDRRRAAIEALRSRNEVASVQALVDAAEEQAESDLMAETAYEMMVSQPMDTIIAQTSASSVNVQTLAYQALGERAVRDGAQGQVLETIQSGVSHRSAAIRGASARALGELGGDESLATLSSMTGDSSAVVRRDVARALGNFNDDENARVLVEYLDDSDHGVVAAAILSLDQRDDPRAADRIDGMLRHDDPRVRAAALRAVTTFLSDDEGDIRRHMGNNLSGALNDSDRRVRLAALEQLGRFENGMAVTNIAILVNSDDPVLRAAAVQALAQTGHADARPLLRSALSDREALVRREAVVALTELVGSEARRELEARMEDEEDPEIRELIQTQLQQI